MLLRDAQEEARILYIARRDSAKHSQDLLLAHMAEATTTLKTLQRTGRTKWEQAPAQRSRAVGLMLLVTLGLANEMEVDSLEAFRSLLLEESS